MAVSEEDLRQVAGLARLGVPEERIPQLLAELNGILAHMEVLRGVDTEGVQPASGIGSGGMPLRADGGTQYPLAVPLADFAPAAREGFLLVPRLASHAAAGALDETPLLDGADAAPDTGAALGADQR